MILEQIMSV